MSKSLLTANTEVPSVTGRGAAEVMAIGAERRQRLWLTFLSFALIAATIAVATMLARWMPPAR